MVSIAQTKMLCANISRNFAFIKQFPIKPLFMFGKPRIFFGKKW